MNGSIEIKDEIDGKCINALDVENNFSEERYLINFLKMLKI